MSARLEAFGIAKSFRIPSARRDSVRDHVLGLFRSRPVEELRVLQDVSLDVGPGETVGIVGRNGSGKSTLLKILCGIYAADCGRVAGRGRLVPVLPSRICCAWWIYGPAATGSGLPATW